MAQNNKEAGIRGARVGATASQFSMNFRYSNAARSHGSPASCVTKLIYDFQLNRRSESRVAFAYISASEQHRHIVSNVVRFAKMCQSCAGRQSNCRQMLHGMVALPADLSDTARNRLVVKICDYVRQMRDGVPVFGAVHRPLPGETNWHLHLSQGLRNIELHSPRVYSLGDRIMSEQRPSIRAAAGLPRTNHAELRTLREHIASLIADELQIEGHDIHIVERWRHGYLRLPQQVEIALQRDDFEFVRDHLDRDPTRHEGLGGRCLRSSNHPAFRTMAVEHNEGSTNSPIGVERIAKTLLNLVIQAVTKLNIRDPRHLRMLAVDHDLIVRWHRPRRRNGTLGRISGIAFQLIGGCAIAGYRLGYSISHVCRVLDLSRQRFNAADHAITPDVVDTYMTLYAPQISERMGELAGSMTNAVVFTLVKRRQSLLKQAISTTPDAKTLCDEDLQVNIHDHDFNKIWDELRTSHRDGIAEYSQLQAILDELDPDDDLRHYILRKLMAHLEQNPQLIVPRSAPCSEDALIPAEIEASPIDLDVSGDDRPLGRVISIRQRQRV